MKAKNLSIARDLCLPTVQKYLPMHAISIHLTDEEMWVGWDGEKQRRLLRADELDGPWVTTITQRLKELAAQEASR